MSSRSWPSQAVDACRSRAHALGMRWAFPEPDGPLRVDVVSVGHVARERDHTGESWRRWRAAALDWRDDLDVRGHAADEPAVVSHDHPIRALVAADHDDGDDGVVAGQHAADADQHAGAVRVRLVDAQVGSAASGLPRRHASKPISPAPTVTRRRSADSLS